MTYKYIAQIHQATEKNICFSNDNILIIKKSTHINIVITELHKI